jgi:hypothetical protein
MFNVAGRQAADGTLALLGASSQRIRRAAAVPVERLQQLYDEFAVQSDAKPPHRRFHEDVRSAFGDSFAREFCINAQVI